MLHGTAQPASAGRTFSASDTRTRPLWYDRPPHSVAVLRALQLGDLLCAVPALRALRHALPEARITLVALPWAREFVRRFDRYVDGLLEFPGYPGLPETSWQPDEVVRFLSRAQEQHFDLVLQMHGSGSITNPLALLLGGRCTAGFFERNRFCPGSSFFPYPESGPEPRRLLALLESLGIEPRGEELEFPLTVADLEAAGRLRRRHGLDGAYACIHVGSRDPSRRWPPRAFGQAARWLASQGMRVVFTGTQEETDLVEAAMRRTSLPAINLAGRTGLGELAGLLRSARLLLCNDTGVSHLAAALRVPSVVVFTGSDPDRWAPLDRRRHRAVAAAADNGHLAPWSPPCERVIAEVKALLHEESIHAA